MERLELMNFVREDYCTHPGRSWCDCDWCHVRRDFARKAALPVYKSILRNAPAFTGNGTPRVWDLPTLHVSYPQTALLLRDLLAILEPAGLVR